ncbi:MAG TPA: preprotein translocase subunit YajC [Acidimicrobiales bacterium]|nr:preprotein translocase subunit YajC [Acidimicrobiales bacterium]
MSSLLATGLVLAASGSKAKGSSPIFYILLLALAVGVYYFFLRPRNQRARQAREQIKQAAVGDEIATIGGLVGTIVSEDGDRVTVSTGSGTELVFLRQAIGRKLTPPAEPTDPADHEQFEGTPPGFDGPAGSDTTPTGEEPDTK